MLYECSELSAGLTPTFHFIYMRMGGKALRFRVNDEVI